MNYTFHWYQAFGALPEMLWGALVTVDLPALVLEVSLKRFDDALTRVDTVTSRLQRKESWLVRRAEILKLAGRDADSRLSYNEALKAIDRLPPSHRQTRATLQLESSIRSALRAEPASTNVTASSKQEALKR